MITIDFETKSAADLRRVGAWVYSLHPTTEIICAAYGIGNEPIQTWWPGKYETNSMPNDLSRAIAAGTPVEAHNVSFEKSIWYNLLKPTYGWGLPSPEQWRDTQAVAAYLSLPPSLEKLLNACGFEGKNADGARLITKYSKLHNKTAKHHIPDHEWVAWKGMTKTERDANPGAKEAGGYYCEDFKKFVQYCVDDVICEQAVSDFMGDLPASELAVFHMDQDINLRGVYLDEKSIRDAICVVEEKAHTLSKEFEDITGHPPSKVAKVMEWFEDRGRELDNLQKDYLEEVLKGDHGGWINDDSNKEVKRAIELRLSYAKAATKKLTTMLAQRDHEGRARFQSKYHGASTGRWTGQGIQLLNLSKGIEGEPPERLVKAISHRSPKFLDAVYGDAMDAVGKASRHHIKAADGHRIIAGDFVSIEAVLLSCLAGEEWKINAFRTGEPLYELMGCKIHKLPQEAVDLARRDKGAFKKKYPAERFDGKTGELAFGYQGGLGAWRNFDSSDTHTDDRVNEIKDVWRSDHLATVEFWSDLQWAAHEAVAYPGEEFLVGAISLCMEDQWLWMRLPNGKKIWYFQPLLQKKWPVWHTPHLYDPKDESTWEKHEDCYRGLCDCTKVNTLTYMSQKEGQWKRVSTYGGKLAENATQATSREVLIPAMFRLQKAGYPIILTVYDEIVCEVPDGFGSVEELSEIMASSPGSWATYRGEPWPISVDAWEGDRYRK
jgi:DNA polymerase